MYSPLPRNFARFCWRRGPGEPAALQNRPKLLAPWLIMMKIVVAPDSFKECLSAREVALVLADALQERIPEVEVVQIPLADGGEGTLDVLSAAMGATLIPVTVHDPLGRSITAYYGLSEDAAIIEVAQACGIQLVKPEGRNPFRADTRGVGELLLAARERGCFRFIVGLGGTVTCDGGRGMLSVPGVRELLQESEVELLCDVQGPLTGPTGAIRLFGPQKGASPADVEVLEADMLQWAARMQTETGVNVKDRPGAGAAGGLGAAFMAYAHPAVFPGIQRVLDLCHFDQAATGASLVITGEGRSDRQTLQGKVPLGVLQRISASSHAASSASSGSAVPVVLLSGRIDDAPALRAAGFAQLIEVSPRNLPLSLALTPAIARQNLRTATHKIWW